MQRSVIREFGATDPGLRCAASRLVIIIAANRRLGCKTQHCMAFGRLFAGVYSPAYKGVNFLSTRD